MRIVSKSERQPATRFAPLVRPQIAADKLRILLVKPDIGEYAVGFTYCVPPLDLLTTAAAAEGHDVQIVDMRLEEDGDFERIVETFDPHVVGVTSYSAEAECARQLCRRAKATLPGVTTLQGGYHAFMAPEDALAGPALDFVIMGEAESILPPFFAALREGRGFEDVKGLAYRSEGEIVFTPAEDRIQDLDTLPYTDWSLLARYQDRYMLNFLGNVGSIETTRGCPFDCTFCSVWVFNERTYRRKSPERVLEEINRLPECVQIVMFVDDEFWVDDKRSLELADLLLGQAADWPRHDLHYWAQVRTSDISRRPELVEKWSEVGLNVMLLGIESVKNSELKDLHRKRNKVENTMFALKKMREHGVEAWGSFIVNPDWDVEDFEELEAFSREYEVAFPQYCVLTPLPGTPLMDRMIAEGKLDPERLPPELLDFLHTSLPTRLPLTEFYRRVASLYKNTGVFSSRKIHRRLLKNGVMSKKWLRRDMLPLVSQFYTTMSDPECYFKTHRLLGDDLERPYRQRVPAEAVAI